MKQDRKMVSVTWLNGIVLSCIFFVSYGYFVLGPGFAEIHVRLPGLDFPIFISEILFMVCCTLILVKLFVSHSHFKSVHLLLVFYVFFVALKMSWGCAEWGPLALRHAALFYFPFFGVLTFTCYEPLIKKQEALIGFCFLTVLALLRGVYAYSVFPLTMLFGLCLCKLRDRRVKWAMAVLASLVLPYGEFFASGRTRILGNAVGFLTFFVLLVTVFLSSRKRYKVLLISIIVCILGVTVVKVSDQNAIKSLADYRAVLCLWDKFSTQVEEKKSTFIFQPLPVRLFSRNTGPFFLEEREEDPVLEKGLEQDQRAKTSNMLSPSNVLSPSRGGNYGTAPEKGEDPVLIEERPLKKELLPPMRSLASAQNNILFRIFIWQDVIRELRGSRLIWGQDFGYPFRSRSLEILGWADDAWGYDGWIAVHNSYLDLIYRGGLVGWGLIGVILFCFWKIMSFAVVQRFYPGVFFSAIVCYWFVVPFFTEFLEMPYTAIIFWSALGLILADIKKKKLLSNNLE